MSKQYVRRAVFPGRNPQEVTCLHCGAAAQTSEDAVIWYCSTCKSTGYYQTEFGVYPHAGYSKPDGSFDSPGKVCDFCGSHDPIKVFEAETYRIETEPDPDTDHISLGGWAACALCASYIDRNDRRGLAIYGARQIRRRFPRDFGKQPEGVVIAYVIEMHKGFFEHRRGS
jgi:hypothetical protein